MSMKKLQTLIAVLATGLVVASGVALAAPDQPFGADRNAVVSLPDDPWRGGVTDVVLDGRGRLVASGAIAPRENGKRLGLRGFVVRLRADGTLDPSFGDAGIVELPMDAANGVAVQGDGRIVAVGETFGAANLGRSPRTDAIVVRLDRDGELDPTFGTRGKSERWGAAAEDVAIQRDGKIVVPVERSRSFDSSGSVYRLLPDGRPDRSFGRMGGELVVAPRRGGWQSSATDVIQAPDGALLVAGRDRDLAMVARVTPDGRLDDRFGGDGRATIRLGPGIAQAEAVRIAPDGGVVVLANEGRGEAIYEEPWLLAVARFDPAGRLDRAFGPGNRGFILRPKSFGWGLLVQRSGRIVVAGDLYGYAPRRFMTMRLSAGGELDGRFGEAAIEAPRVGRRTSAAMPVEVGRRVVVIGSRYRGAAGEGRAIVLRRYPR